MPILKQAESTFVPVPAGAHPARCYSMVSLGTQTPNNPQYKSSFQVVLSFELPTELMEFNGEKKPMVQSCFLNAYLGRASKPSKTHLFLVAWRGRAFTEAELEKFDLSTVVGAPCLLNIVHEVKDGKTVAKIQSISPLPKGMTVPPQVNKSVVYEIEQGKDAVFNSLSEWMKKKIESCEEWVHPAALEEPETEQADNSDVPF